MHLNAIGITVNMFVIGCSKFVLSQELEVHIVYLFQEYNMDKAISNYVDIELQFGYKRDEFKSLATTEKRFIYAYKNLNIFSFDNFKDNNGKNLQKGLMLKEEGNKLFSLGDVKRALKLYSESVITLPHRNEGK